MKIWKAIVNFFTIVCPHCSRRLDKNRSEDHWMPSMHECYHCGHNFVEGGDGLE